MGGKDSGVSF